VKMNLYQELHAALLAHKPKSLGKDNLVGPACCALGALGNYRGEEYRYSSVPEVSRFDNEVCPENDLFKGTDSERYQHMLAWSEERGKL